MTNLEIFKSDEFGVVRTAIVHNEPYFVARDIAERLGYTNPQKATRDHVDVDDRMLLQVSDLQGVNETLPPHRRNATITVINESGLYSLIIRSQLESAKRFKKWITREVLPSIRKHGGYIADVKGESDEELTLRVMTMLQNKILEREKALKTANDTIKEQQPAVDFLESVKVSETSILIKDLATLLNQKGIATGQNRLFKWMRENGYLLSTKGYYNKPSQRASEMKVLEYRLTTIEKPNGDIITTFVPLVTGKGIVYFMGKFLKE